MNVIVEMYSQERPGLHVITDGVQKGCVTVHPKWAGFKADDYKRASKKVYDKTIQIKSMEVKVKSGVLDLHCYEIARAQFFDTLNKVCVTLSSDTMNFSTECVRKFNSQFIEVLVHPGERFIAIRPSTKDSRNAVQWSKKHNEITYQPFCFY